MQKTNTKPTKLDQLKALLPIAEKAGITYRDIAQASELSPATTFRIGEMQDCRHSTIVQALGGLQTLCKSRLKAAQRLERELNQV